MNTEEFLNAIRLQHPGVPGSRSTGTLDPEKWPVNETPNIDSSYIVEIRPDDESPWEYLKDRSGKLFAVAVEDNAVHFYRTLKPRPEQKPVPEQPRAESEHVASALIYSASEFRKYRIIADRLNHNDYFVDPPTDINASTLLNKIEKGTDSLLLFAHGQTGDTVRVSDGEDGTCTLGDLERAILTGSTDGKCQLRFALLMLCEIHQSVIAMLQRLAEQGALHEQFGGLVFWGSPKTDFGQLFTVALLQTLLENPDPERPFLHAVHAARLAVKGSSRLPQTPRPIAVAFHEWANPLPDADGLASETYTTRLRRIEVTR
jgi:hypothetical protein